MTMPAPSPNSPSQLIAALSRLMRRHPAQRGILWVTRAAILQELGPGWAEEIILTSIESGAQTYADLQKETGLTRDYLHRHIHRLIRQGQVRQEQEPKRGNFRPRKLFFLTK